jgi:peptide/nickel transport system permease protein
VEAREFREDRQSPIGASADLIAVDAATASAPASWRILWQRFRRDRLALVALVVVGLIVAIALAAPAVVAIVGAPAPSERDPAALDPVFATPTGPSSAHPFGVDQIGRDVFSRTVYGARTSLSIAFVATALATLLGVVAGVAAGYFRGWADTLISRGVDVLLAIPYLLLATGLAAACTVGGAAGGGGCLGGAIQPGTGVVIFVIAATSWTYMARIVRGQTLSLGEREFIEAARAAGASGPRIIVREILPNLVAPITVYASLLLPQVILFEAALSFLGVGIADRPSWGQMISDATPIFADAWWYMLFPGLALLLTVLAFNLIGDALRDALSPRGGHAAGAWR